MGESVFFPAQKLTGRYVALEPVEELHRDQLRPAAQEDDTIYTYMPMNIARHFDDFFDHALNCTPATAQSTYVVRHLDTGALVGSTRYLNISEAEPRVEIGFTWYAPSSQGTAMNPEAKLLLMQNAFERLGCARVELKSDALNARSRRAMEKMGAKFEGILRRHMKVQEGRIRDTSYYSVLDHEWPDVKSGLEARLAAFEDSAS